MRPVAAKFKKKRLNHINFFYEIWIFELNLNQERSLTQIPNQYLRRKNMTQVQTELFTDLTQEQSATVEGGAVFTLHSVFAANAKKQDDLYIKFEGEKIFGTRDMDSRDFVRVEKSDFFYGKSFLSFYDKDKGIFNSDDYLGGQWISDSPISNGQARVTGKGYDYIVNYSVS